MSAKGNERAPAPAYNSSGCSNVSSYEFLDKLGEGTFGEVYKARNKASNALVAMKLILMHNEKEGFPITALREIRIMKKLSHPNILRLVDMSVSRGDRAQRRRGKIYMVTPYMDHDLSGLLENPSVHLSEAQIKCYFRQLLSGVAYLHANKILHRDMKASNLLIDNHGILRIADFGLARGFDEDPPVAGAPHLARAGRDYTNMVVTRWYRPPELLLGERKYTTAIDMWGVGCVFGEMFTSRPILPGHSDLDQIIRIFQLCGTPTEESMPGWDSLPGCEGQRVFKPHKRTLESVFMRYGAPMVAMLAALLVLDPARRLSAEEALDHSYFTTQPLPMRPEDVPTYAASHEANRQKHRDMRAAAAAAPPPAPAGGTVGNEGIGSRLHEGDMPTTSMHRSGGPHQTRATHPRNYWDAAARGDGGRPYGKRNTPPPSDRNRAVDERTRSRPRYAYGPAEPAAR